ncbi:MAG: recombination-associated protein RdgC [Steroidobacteraceae bacterium]
MSAAELEGQLADRPLQSCGPFEMTSRGWMPVMRGGRLLHTVNRHYMIALGANEKLLPGSDKSKTMIRHARHPPDGKEIHAHLAAGRYRRVSARRATIGFRRADRQAAGQATRISPDQRG